MPYMRLFDPAGGPIRDSSPVSVADVVRLYLAHSVATGLHGPEAFEERRRTLGLFADEFGSVPVVDCKPFMLSDWIEARQSWRSVSTRRAKANQVRACFQWAANGERIDRNPFARVRYAEAERRPELPDDVLERIATLANKPFEYAVRFLRLTGCRLSELCRATWEDVSLDGGVWVIHRHKSRRYTGKPKVVALVAEAVTLLRSVQSLTLFADGGPIFRNTRNRPWTRRTLGQQLARMKKRHGIQCKATLHGARHRAASAAVANGASLPLIAAQLGHASPAITSRYYVHLEGQIDAIREAMAKGLPK